jgi:hypothetical protein
MNNPLINSSDVLNFSKEINGFTAYEDSMSGTLEWNDAEGNIIYATPNWSEDGIVPFDFADADGNYDNISSLYTINYPTKSEQLIVYFNTLLELTNNLEELKERVSNI